MNIDPELAKATGQVVVETAADARRALGAIFGDAAAEVANIFSDTVKLWRFKNLLRIRDEVNEIAAQRGLTQDQLKALPLGDSLRVADAAANEDQPEIQALWARLIANVVTGASSSIERAFIDLLKSLSPGEAALLDLLWQYQDRPSNFAPFDQRGYDFEDLQETPSGKSWLALSSDVQQVSLQNLLRLRCIALPPPREDPFMVRNEIISADYAGQSMRTLDTRAVQETFRQMGDYLRLSVGGDPVRGMGPGLEWYRFKLTSLGSALMSACVKVPSEISARHAPG